MVNMPTGSMNWPISRCFAISGVTSPSTGCSPSISVKLRLDREQPLTFLEFNYMILQAYDFVELTKRHDCVLQMGGSDQWGNIVNGIDLGRRVAERELFGPDHAPHHHRLGRKDGQARGRCGLAPPGNDIHPMTTGNSGETPKTRMSDAF